MNYYYNNRLIKFARLVLYKESSIVEEFAYIFVREIITTYGILEEIVLDRDKLLTL